MAPLRTTDTNTSPRQPDYKLKGPLQAPPSPPFSPYSAPVNNENIDHQMTDAFATPTQVKHQHKLDTSSKLAGPFGTRPTGLLSKSRPPMLSALHPSLQPSAGPLTPPLTPPSFAPVASTSYHQIVHQPPPPAPASPTPVPIIGGGGRGVLSSKSLIGYALHGLFAAQYAIQEELGCGGFGFVVRAARLADGLSVAVKFIERQKIPAHGWVKSRAWGDAPGLAPAVEGARLLPLEAFLLRSINHEGVVRFVDLFEDQKYFYLVMEHHGSPWQSGSGAQASVVSSPAAILNEAAAPAYPSPTSSPMMASNLSLSAFNMTPGSPLQLSPPKAAPPMLRRSSCDLFECIEQHSRFDTGTAKFVFAQLVEVVYHLGRMGICHRDIKDENIVISSDFRIKLIDFGSAVIFDPARDAPRYNRFYGTTSFAAAEILRGEPYQPPKSEVWSLGVLLSILTTGECPFANVAAATVGKMSRSKVYLEPELEDLMRRCLDVDQDRRIRIDQVRQHPWLRGALAGRC